MSSWSNCNLDYLKQNPQQVKSYCTDGCVVYSDVVESPLSPILPTPLLSPTLTEASMALDRDPGIYRIDYDLTDQKSQATADVTSNLTAFIFQVQNGTRSHFYFKVSVALIKIWLLC